MKAYWVCVYEKIDNPEKLKEYAVKARPAIEKFSGKFLARGGKNRTTAVSYTHLTLPTKA